MTFPMYLVDAFIDQPFSGNPAGVCVLSTEQPASWMQKVALEMNQAETAFVHKRADGSWNLRWFTPQVEVDLCGHATLAAAHALWQEVGVCNPVIHFHTRSGILSATRNGDEIQLDFPCDQPKTRDLPPALLQFLGKPPVWFGCGRDDLLLVLDNAAAVENFIPDLNLISAITERGLIITAPGDADSGLDMVSRFFAPKVGIAEDPVTGSAHCLLAVYWGYRFGKNHLRARQASPRGGLLTLELQRERVLLSGKTKTMLKGEFYG
ncbi:PhzF family phenazine biosynthesis protein [Cellvibrio sp. NN19]|uniref:PhzF family phenazine biosynthesis protein n=1 Tax=Cellvibrio chitinivorans TaxID=3102792 RepID=UPI002B40A42C|nr:PhzF family phenazine biosynthesis protein [Cellvibrio sp. NN19]